MKKILILLLVLTGGVASAADFMDSFSAYRSQIRRKLGVDVTNTTYISDSTLNEYIREGVVMVAPLVKGDRAIRTVNVQYRRTDYTLDSLVTGVQSVTICKNDTVKALLYVPQNLWYQQEHRTTVGQQDGYLKRPSYYDYFDNTLLIYPPPTLLGDTIKINTWQKIGNISAVTSLTNLHPFARVAVLKYACWQAAQGRQHPMTGLFQQEYEKSLFDVSNSIDANTGNQSANSGNTAPSSTSSSQ